MKSKSLLKILISDKKVGSACEEYEDNEGGILGECFSETWLSWTTGCSMIAVVVVVVVL